MGSPPDKVRVALCHVHHRATGCAGHVFSVAGTLTTGHAPAMVFRLRALSLAAVVASASSLTGCATTQAWERESLAKPCMEPDPAPFRQALKHHYLSTREGAVGGLGGGGGGCGCN